MRPDAITLLFKKAFDIFPPLEGKPTDDDFLTIREALLPILMVIPFNAVGGILSSSKTSGSGGWVKNFV